MTWLGAGIAVFFGVHLLPSCRLLREKLIGAIGELPYKGVFAVLSLAGLALIIKGMSEAPYIAVWEPPPSAKMATAIFMVPALVLLVAANFNTNIKRIVRHPMSLGVLLWSLSHSAVKRRLGGAVSVRRLRAVFVIRYALGQPAHRRTRRDRLH